MFSFNLALSNRLALNVKGVIVAWFWVACAVRTKTSPNASASCPIVAPRASGVLIIATALCILFFPLKLIGLEFALFVLKLLFNFV